MIDFPFCTVLSAKMLKSETVKYNIIWNIIQSDQNLFGWLSFPFRILKELPCVIDCVSPQALCVFLKNCFILLAFNWSSLLTSVSALEHFGSDWIVWLNHARIEYYSIPVEQCPDQGFQGWIFHLMKLMIDWWYEEIVDGLRKVYPWDSTSEPMLYQAVEAALITSV